MANTFSVDLHAFIEKAKVAPSIVMQKTALELLTDTVLGTPVGNPSLWKHPAPKGYVGGRARANWNVSLNSPDLSTSEDVDASGGATISAGAQVIGGAKAATDSIYIMNSVPYINALEYEGHSSQAPAGMVRIAVMRAQEHIAEAVASLG